MASKLANFSQHGLSAGSQPWVSDTSILSKHAPRLHRSDTDLFALLLKHDLIARFKAQSMTHRFGHRDLSFAGYPCLSLHCDLQFLTLARRSLLSKEPISWERLVSGSSGRITLTYLQAGTLELLIPTVSPWKEQSITGIKQDSFWSR